MTSDVIRNHFATVARDLTLPCVRQTAYVLYAPIYFSSELSKNCVSVLSDAELNRANRFADECNRALFLQRRAFRRFCGAAACGTKGSLSQLLFEETDLGQPYLANFPYIKFSFSSSRFGLLGAWSFTNEIGVDLEYQKRQLEATKLAHQYFSQAEAQTIEDADNSVRIRKFYQFWSLKEASLKSIGQGLPFGLDTFQFELDPGLRVTHAPAAYGGPERFSAHMIVGTPGCAALVIHSAM